MRIEVCILAGGKSSRMGRNKAAIKAGGVPLLEWARRIAAGAGFSARVIDRDLGESRGPVSGIETALRTSKAARVIFLPCDMPFVRSSTLQELAKNGGAVFAQAEGLAGFPFALPRRFKPRGESLQDLARGSGATFLPLAPDEAANVNTPLELERAKGRLAEEARDIVLDVDGLSMRRGTVEILRGINWQVRRGEHWAMLGANGSGKTTLLSVLTGYASATTGRIRMLGQEWGRSDWREMRGQVGLVSSSVRQLMAEGETALETVASGRNGTIDLWGPVKSGDARRARQILEGLGCGHLEKRAWAVLSQGERQRVLIGRALMGKPKALILDEPCAGLDPAAREDFLGFVQEMTAAKASPTIILVTHHVEEIVPGITHVLALKGGAVAGKGEKRTELTRRLMEQIFECSARLRFVGGRYSLRCGPRLNCG